MFCLPDPEVEKRGSDTSLFTFLLGVCETPQAA